MAGNQEGKKREKRKKGGNENRKSPQLQFSSNFHVDVMNHLNMSRTRIISQIDHETENK
jgi:hypothetical protein